MAVEVRPPLQDSAFETVAESGGFNMANDEVSQQQSQPRPPMEMALEWEEHLDQDGQDIKDYGAKGDSKET